MRFSANLGFLWAGLPLPAAIRAAKAAGFHAVECHWPFDQPASEVKEALAETGLPLLGLNTRRGNVGDGENGLAALPGREAAARAAIDEALDYARATDCGAVHVMAGHSDEPRTRATYCANLAYACDAAARDGRTILIEPLNRYDAPGYFLTTTSQAAEIIGEVGAPNLRLMFDCYHVQIMEGDVSRRLETLLPLIGHIQFASVPDRGTPDHGELDYGHIFSHIEALGYARPLGAEYKPKGDTLASLGWLAATRNLQLKEAERNQDHV
ncbi:MAG TPA: TIM barrel protein [Kiloniellaceae bacterium]|nr:TIM barrel protein [Kiloniellaceae bacterium]